MGGFMCTFVVSADSMSYRKEFVWLIQSVGMSLDEHKQVCKSPAVTYNKRQTLKAAHLSARHRLGEYRSDHR